MPSHETDLIRPKLIHEPQYLRDFCQFSIVTVAFARVQTVFEIFTLIPGGLNVFDLLRCSSGTVVPEECIITGYRAVGIGPMLKLLATSIGPGRIRLYHNVRGLRITSDSKAHLEKPPTTVRRLSPELGDRQSLNKFIPRIARAVCVVCHSSQITCRCTSTRYYIRCWSPVSVSTRPRSQ